MRIAVKIKKITPVREWNDKQTGEVRKCVEVVAEEISADQYKNMYTFEVFDQKADAFKDTISVGDAVTINPSFRVVEREYETKDKRKAVEYKQKVNVFYFSKL